MLCSCVIRVDEREKHPTDRKSPFILTMSGAFRLNERRNESLSLKRSAQLAPDCSARAKAAYP